MNRPTLSFAHQRGFSLMEVLITLVVTAFGLLSLAGVVSRSTGMNVDAQQRARAAALLADMGNRIQNNKANAATYVTGDVYGETVNDNCPAALGAPRDLCEWNNLLAGANDALSNNAAQALTFRGCITQPTPGDPMYVITVAWGSLVPGIAPADTCAQNAFGDDSNRRVIRTQVRITNLAA